MERTRTGSQRRSPKREASREAPSTSGARQGLIQAGELAPDFTLKTTPDQSVSLSDLRGQRVALVFYPADWSPVCGDELALFNEVLPEIKRHKALLVGVSVDGVWCHKAFAEARKLHFPLLSDFEPKGSVARDYGAYRSRDGVCERALVLVDENGRVVWSYLSPVGVNPGADGLLAALEQRDQEQAPAEPKKEQAA